MDNGLLRKAKWFAIVNHFQSKEQTWKSSCHNKCSHIQSCCVYEHLHK